MARKVFSFIFLVLGILIGAGGIGHSAGVVNVQAALNPFPIEHGVAKAICQVWVSMGACMFLFGVMIVWIWYRQRRGQDGPLFIAALIGIFYAVAGIGGWIYRPQDSLLVVFIVLGALLMVCSYVLRPQRG
jgi:hypothetical protein